MPDYLEYIRRNGQHIPWTWENQGPGIFRPLGSGSGEKGCYRTGLAGHVPFAVEVGRTPDGITA